MKDIKDAPFVGFGIGYSWNNWLRFDFTGEYRADVKFKAVGSYTEFCDSGRCFDAYDGDHQVSVFLVNAYLDLGTWWCVTPFVGVGVGQAYHKISALTDVGLGLAPGGFPLSVLGYADKDYTKWNMAWAAHAGLAYNVTNNFKVEFAYRYLNMGSAQTAEINCAVVGLRHRQWTARLLHAQGFRIARPQDRLPVDVAAGCAAASAGLCASAHAQGLSEQPGKECERRGKPPAPFSLMAFSAESLPGLDPGWNRFAAETRQRNRRTGACGANRSLRLIIHDRPCAETNPPNQGVVMRRLLVALGLIASVSGAFAADYELPTLRGSDGFVPAMPAIPVIRPRWDGFYVGAHAGYGFASMDFATSTRDLVAHCCASLRSKARCTPRIGKCSARSDTTGSSIGGFVGYSIGWESLILGVELNYSRTNLAADAPVSPLTRVTSANGLIYLVNLTGSASMHITDFGTLRARAGYEVGNFLPWAMIGVAAGRANIRRSATVSGTETVSRHRPPCRDPVLVHGEREQERSIPLRLVVRRRPRYHADAEHLPARRVRIRGVLAGLGNQGQHPDRTRRPRRQILSSELRIASCE